MKEMYTDSDLVLKPPSLVDEPEWYMGGVYYKTAAECDAAARRELVFMAAVLFAVVFAALVVCVFSA